MMDYRKYFNKAIRADYPESSEQIIGETEDWFRKISPAISFAKTSKNPMDRRLEFCAYFLALIITLDQRRVRYDDIRKICLEIVTDYVKPKSKLHAALKRLPPKLMNTWIGDKFFRLFHERVSKNENPDGFIVNIITDKKQTNGLGFGFDIIECGICKLYAKYNYQKYVPILCEVDKLTSAMAGLNLIRKSTIALGAKTCDFRFTKKTQF